MPCIDVIVCLVWTNNVLHVVVVANRKGLHQSFFVGCSRQSGDKITIKEHHLKNYTEEDESAANEVMILSKLSHPAIPHLQEVFFTDAAAYLVSALSFLPRTLFADVYLHLHLCCFVGDGLPRSLSFVEFHRLAK